MDDGKILREARTRLGLRQAEAGELSDPAVTAGTVARWEAGTFRPNPGFVQALIDRTTDPVLVDRLRRIVRAGPPAATGTASDRAARLARFLGDDVLREGVHLVFSVFQYSDAARSALEQLPEGERIFVKPRARDIFRRRDIVQPVAANDLRALCTIAQLMGSEQIAIHPITDQEAMARKGRFSAVSFGLLSNDLTHLYERLWRARDRVPVFETGTADGWPYVELPDGKRYGYDDDDLGLIARVTPDQGHPGRRWIFCSGLGPTGTEAAATHLVDSWSQIAEIAGDRDFVTPVHCVSGDPTVAYSEVGETLVV